MKPIEADLTALNELVHVALSIICEGGVADCDRMIRKIEKAMARNDGATLAALGRTIDSVKRTAAAQSTCEQTKLCNALWAAGKDVNHD